MDIHAFSFPCLYSHPLNTKGTVISGCHLLDESLVLWATTSFLVHAEVRIKGHTDQGSDLHIAQPRSSVSYRARRVSITKKAQRPLWSFLTDWIYTISIAERRSDHHSHKATQGRIVCKKCRPDPPPTLQCISGSQSERVDDIPEPPGSALESSPL
jgi:hypothetical protein